MGCCPFHSEKSPSFSVDPIKKLFHCFGCGVGGDVFHFVQRQEAVDFPEAVRWLAKEAGVELPEREESPAEKRARDERERMYRVNQIAQEHFVSELSRDPRAQAYLRDERGLDDATISGFNLGFAPNEWDGLTKLFERKDVPVDLPVKLGLLGQRSSGDGVYDRLRGKVVFPIVMPSGEVAGFGARRADWLVRDGDDRGPKYLNSTDSPVYDKSNIFYGLDRAQDRVRRGKRAILVEGYFDVIVLHQAGITDAVACCGTALSTQHASKLARLTKTVVTLYDGDEAGLAATRRTAETLMKAGLRVHVLMLPEGDDPDTFVRREGAAALEEALAAAPSAVDAFLDLARKKHQGAGVAGLVEIVRAIKPLLIAVRDPSERSLYAEGVAQQLRIDPRRLLGSLPEAPPTPRQNREAPRPTRADSPPTSAEAAVFQLLVESPEEVIAALDAANAIDAVHHAGVRAAVDLARHALSDNQPFDAPRALEAAETSASPHTVAELRTILMRELPVKDNLARCIDQLLQKHHVQRLADLKKRIARETDPEAVQTLLAEAEAIRKASKSTRRDFSYAN